MDQIDQILRQICEHHDLEPELLDRLLQCELNKKKLIRKRGLKQDIWQVLEAAVQTEDAPQ